MSQYCPVRKRITYVDKNVSIFKLEVLKKIEYKKTIKSREGERENKEREEQQQLQLFFRFHLVRKYIHILRKFFFHCSFCETIIDGHFLLGVCFIEAKPPNNLHL